MSVLKMIVADDRRYLCGELHGSSAQWVYAACARNPKTLAELDELLPEFGADRDLRGLFGWRHALDLKPVDAGLIIVDLAKKWIFAEDTYFGAHRRGSYPFGAEDEKIFTYEFASAWQFVAEAKWFQYLLSCNLEPYGELDSISGADEDGEMDWENLIATMAEETRLPDTDNEEEVRDEELSSIEAEFTNRWCSLVEVEPENDEERRELQILEHFLGYDQRAAIKQHRVEQARREIESLKIELQAAENLWRRNAEPRWGLKRIHFQAQIGQQEKRISRLADEHSAAAAMAAELRNFLTLKKYLDVLQAWEEGKTGDLFHDEGDIPF